MGTLQTHVLVRRFLCVEVTGRIRVGGGQMEQVGTRNFDLLQNKLTGLFIFIPRPHLACNRDVRRIALVSVLVVLPYL